MDSVILLDTEGGTWLLAMHKKAPISPRAIFVSFNTSPRYEVTERSSRAIRVAVGVVVTGEDYYPTVWHRNCP